MEAPIGRAFQPAATETIAISDHAIDFSKVGQVSLQGTEPGNDLMNEVLKTYKDISSK